MIREKGRRRASRLIVKADVGRMVGGIELRESAPTPDG